MKKRIFVGLLAALAFTFHGFAAGFNKTTAYADGTFTDVPDSEWYASEVKSAYELGFMNGVGGSLFSPDGQCDGRRGCHHGSARPCKLQRYGDFQGRSG